MNVSALPTLTGTAAVAVAVGAALGALLRWWLSAWLNASHPDIPLGTWAANLLGGYLVGVGMAWIMQDPSVSSTARLFLITGFLGGLTTFSTFSAEVMHLMLQGRWAVACSLAAMHLLGSLLATAAGMASWRAWHA